MAEARHLLGIDELATNRLRQLLCATGRYAPVANAPHTNTGDLKGRLIANLFLEASTRTLVSFTLAAHRLGADTIDLGAMGSSMNKGESLIDTALTIEAMGLDAIVVRSPRAGAPHLLAQYVECSVINAGDGKHEHPTQALLDSFTIAEALGRTDDFDFKGMRIVIVGDVAHSRVAGSGVRALTRLGATVRCVGPPGLAPESLRVLGCEVGHDLDEALEGAHVVMMLRIQFERHGSGVIPSIETYRDRYAMTERRLDALSSGTVILHPGPANIGLEIDAAVMAYERSLVRKQVANGVAARMAVLSELLK